MPQERVFTSSTQVYTSRSLAIQEYAKTHPRITGGPEKIGQSITSCTLSHFETQVRSILGKDQDFVIESTPIQEWNIDQEVIRKFWDEQGLADLKRDVVTIPPADRAGSPVAKTMPTPTSTSTSFHSKRVTHNQPSAGLFDTGFDVKAPVRSREHRQPSSTSQKESLSSRPQSPSPIPSRHEPSQSPAKLSRRVRDMGPSGWDF